MIWVWLGAGVSGCTGSFCVPSALYVCVCAVCVREVCGLPSPGVCVYVLVPASWAASMSAGGCPVSQLLSKASMSAVDENYTVYFVITFS